MIRGKHFSAYHAGRLAIDPARPWQIISRTLPAICGKVATEEQARRAVEALDADKEAGRLPCNLSTWDKVILLE